MNLGQSILAAAALIAITILVISANRLIVQSQQDEYRSIAFNQASEIASALMNEALSKKFGTNVNPAYYQPPSEFTDPSALGPEGSEPRFSVSIPDTATTTSTFRSLGSYNDFDDYNGYVRKVNTPALNGFIATCTVTYVQSGNLNVVSTSKGYFKRIVVTVQHPVYLSPISFSAVKTY
ncbi:MAG: hypothetical protein NTX44_02720 [Ignavibacteriales bacterium]|nr:hypothetical protein [Ignavibacteriales bacterium]